MPFYIISQIMGAMIATWCVYGMYKVEFDAIHSALAAGGAAGQAQIFSPAGVSSFSCCSVLESNALTLSSPT